MVHKAVCTFFGVVSLVIVMAYGLYEVPSGICIRQDMQGHTGAGHVLIPPRYRLTY